MRLSPLLTILLGLTVCCAGDELPHHRVVWVQDQTAGGSDSLAHGKQLRLMGFDSRDGRGERAILDPPRSYAKPLLTPDGRRVVYSDHQTQKAYVVNFDGGGKRQICDGLAVDVWADPRDGTPWLYACKQVGALGDFRCRTVRRLKLDDPKSPQIVWNETEISPDNFQLSADGTRAAGEFPWPNGGLADLVRKTWTKRASGCWSSLAPDNSGLSWVFDGPHRNLQMFPGGSGEPWKVNINAAPGIDGFEVFHPRWSNHVRYFAMTGPYKVDGPVNRISGGGPAVEVYLGRFASDFRSVESWTQITRNQKADFYPDAWVEGGAGSAVPASLAGTTPAVAPSQNSWPGSTAGLEFCFPAGDKPFQIPAIDGRPARTFPVEPHGRAWYGRHWSMQLAGGQFLPEGADRPLLAACRKSNALTIEAVITSSSGNAGLGQIVTFSSAEGRNFSLSDDRGRLTLSLATAVAKPTPIPLFKLEAERPTHVLITCAAGEVRCYRDGAAVPLDGKRSTDFRGWTEQRLSFGSEADGTSAWRGRLEGVAIYSRALSAAEAAEHWRLSTDRMAGRKSPEPVVVQARRVEVSQVPDPKSILPYRRALVVHRYDVERAIKGRLADREILIAQWAILDGAVLPESRVKTSETVTLTVEPFDDHPELKGERQVLDTDRVELPLFLDVGAP